VFEPDAQSSEVVQPRKGALDDPAGLSWTAAVRLATAGNLRGDASGMQWFSIFVVVVATAGLHHDGRDGGRPRLPRMGGMAASNSCLNRSPFLAEAFPRQGRIAARTCQRF